MKKAIGIIVAIVVFGIAIIVIRNHMISSLKEFQLKSMAIEAKTYLKALSTAERYYFEDRGELVAVGPVPAQIPAGTAVEFTPDAGCLKIGFTLEGPVRYQYEAKITGPKTAILFARGDLNGDGRTSEYRLDLNVESQIFGDIVETNPLE